MYIALILLVLLGLELVTGHWFAGFYIFDIAILGAGDPVRLVTIVFLGVLASMGIGSVFAASWVRFGARGPQLIAAGLVLVILVAILIALPSFPAIAEAFQLWWLAVFAVVVIAVSAVGSWLLLRRAIVR